MADLITRARAIYNLDNRATTSAENTTIDVLVSAASKAIKRHCKREFNSTQFDELYNGNNQHKLMLRQWPIISIDRLAYTPTQLLRITNTSSTNQRATVAVTSAGLSLTKAASGVATTDTSVIWATYPTLATVAAAVNALGNGWLAVVNDSNYNNWASADLRAVQGAMQAKNIYANLVVHTNELDVYDMDAAAGILIRSQGLGVTEFFDHRHPQWFGGLNYWRVIYTAGFATIPEDVQEACAQWVAWLFWQTKRDPGLSTESISSLVTRTPTTELPPTICKLLAPYRDVMSPSRNLRDY